MGDKTAGMQVFFPVETSALVLEILQQAVESRTPIRRAEGQEKVIATDMPDKIPRGINSIIQALRQAQEHFVALGVAVDIDSAEYMNCCMGMPAGLSGYAKRIYKNDAVEFDARTANFYLNENAKLVWLRFNVLGFKIRSFNLLNWA